MYSNDELVSVIMPAYKRRYLKAAITSVLAQTHENVELIVVDDASPEDLKSVVDCFNDSRLSYFRNAKNLGGSDLVMAWEYAMKYARGVWCVLAGDDDVYLPNCIASLLELRDRYPTCDLFHARSAMIDENGNWVSISHERLQFESQIQFAYARAARHCDQQAPDFMFRLSAFKAVGGFVRFPLAWFSDDATWMLLAQNGCAHTSDVQFCFRMSGINITSTFDSKVVDKIKAGEDFRSWLRKFSSTLNPSTLEEQTLMSRFLPECDLKIDSIARYEMRMIPRFGIWLKVLRRCSCSSVLRRWFVWDRIRSQLANFL